MSKLLEARRNLPPWTWEELAGVWTAAPEGDPNEKPMQPDDEPRKKRKKRAAGKKVPACRSR